MTVKSLTAGTAVLVLACGVAIAEAQASDPPVLQAVLSTTPLFNYDDAPATPDADDPAVWINRQNPGRSLVIGTAKDAGLLVYDLRAGSCRPSCRRRRLTSRRAIRPRQRA